MAAPKPAPTTTASPGGYSLDQIAAQLGLSPVEKAQAIADMIKPQTATATNDPNVYLGPGAPAVTKKGHTVPGQASHTATRPVYVPAEGDHTTTSSAAYKQFLGLTPDEKAQIQQQMFIAGYYGKNANAHDILFGQADPGSIQAWMDAVNQAAYAYGAGTKITIADLLRQQALGFGAAGVTTDKYGNRISAAEIAAKGAAGPKVSVTSASELAKMAQQLGVSILGRAANQDEQRLIIAAVQRQEAAYTGSGGGGERPAPQAIAEDVLRSKAPVEAQAHDFASNYGQLLKIVGGSANA